MGALGEQIGRDNDRRCCGYPAGGSVRARLLGQMKNLIARRHKPDGWNVGWNVEPVGGQHIPHARCHLGTRYAEEPFAGRGIRSWINIRPAARRRFLSHEASR